jgi:hypothetical protein
MPYKDEAIRKAKQKLYSRKWYEGNRQKVIKRPGRNLLSMTPEVVPASSRGTRIEAIG